MKVLILLAVLACAALYVQAEDLKITAEEEKEFADFKVKFDKNYEGAQDEQKRKDIFVKTYRDIKAHNKLFDEGKTTYTQGINQFADRLPSEVSTGLKIH